MIDLHAHLDDKNFEQDLGLVLERAKIAGIEKIVCPSVSFGSIEKVIKIAQEYDFVLPMIGIHPHESQRVDFSHLETKLEAYLQKEKFFGFGEIGLDYFYDAQFKKEQIELLERQLALAEKYRLPVVLHIRDAFSDLFSILQNFPKITNFIWHSFSGNFEEAKKFLDYGGYLSFSGMLTFAKSEELRKILKSIPIERIFFETDSPYLTPEPYRGQRNEPNNVSLVYQKASELRKITLVDLRTKIKINFQNVFASFF